jgi:hypothetical protein
MFLKNGKPFLFTPPTFFLFGPFQFRSPAPPQHAQKPSRASGPARPASLSPRAAADGRDPALIPPAAPADRVGVELGSGPDSASVPRPPRARALGHLPGLFKASPLPSRAAFAPSPNPWSRRRRRANPSRVVAAAPLRRRPSVAVKLARGSVAR